MSVHPIIQVSTSLRGEGQVVARVSSPDDIATADELLDMFNNAILGKMNALASSLKDNPGGIDLIQSQLGGVPIAPLAQAYPQVPTQAPPAPMTMAPPAPSSGGMCHEGSKGPHQMACKAAHPIGPRVQMGQWKGHACAVNPKDSQRNPNGCGPTWCN